MIPEWLYDFFVNLGLIVGVGIYMFALFAFFFYVSPIAGFIWLAIGIAGVMTWIMRW